MEYNAKNAPADAGIDLQTVVQYAKRVALKWWAVLLSAVIFAGIGFGIAKINYVPMYSSTIRFVVDNKSENTVTGGQTSSDINAAISLAVNYKQIMTDTNSLMELVAKDSGYDVSAAEVKGMISASLEKDTTIIKLTVTSSDPDVTYAVSQSYIRNYSTVTEKAYQSTRAIVIDNAVKPTVPNGDNSMMLYAVLGFILGAGIVIVAICMDIFIKDTIKTPDDLTNKLDTKVIGSVVGIKKNDKKGKPKKSVLITDRTTGFMFIESFKLIRTKIENFAKRQKYKTFIFTSASENEGKTTITVNTALALAKTGKSVLLIDADLRKPAVYKTLGVSAADEKGIAGVVNEERELSESIKYFEKFNLFLLITSQPIAEPTEILSSDKMAKTIEAVRNEFDYVIIDTPPGGIVADASILAQYTDGCVMVIKRDYAPLRRIKRTMDDISGSGAEIVGCVFNDAEVSAASKFIKTSKRRKKAHEYGYYGYGYGYGDSKEK